jgi:hypothetical protein
MAQIFWGVGSPGTVSTANGGKVSAATVGTTGAQIIAGNPSRQSITFANVGSANLFVFPVTNAAGGINAPSNANPAGSFVVMPGANLVIGGECQLGWGAFAVNANSPLTVMESNN